MHLPARISCYKDNADNKSRLTLQILIVAEKTCTNRYIIMVVVVLIDVNVLVVAKLLLP